jgi:hypothetical protein
MLLSRPNAKRSGRPILCAGASSDINRYGSSNHRWSDKVIAEHSKEPFFAKVIASQKMWMKRIQPYLVANTLGSAELAAAYRHFLG